MNKIRKFLAEVQDCYRSGNASEHSYRPMLQHLIAGLSGEIQVINEPKRIDCGAPDFSINKENIDIGHIEAKDLHVNIEDLKGPNNEQLRRYRKALPNLIYTNCLDWHFYRYGKRVQSVSIGELTDKVNSRPDQFKNLESLLEEFITAGPKIIKTSEHLAKAMANKSYLAKHIFIKSLLQDKDRDADESLWPQYLAFKKNLMLEISVEDFAEIYAETIAYGMFAARLNDDGHGDFNRMKAAELLPKTNPFLRHLFSYIAGPTLDERIAWIIDSLADLMRSCDISKIVSGFGSLKGQKDPFLHFYETFLATYNPQKRKAKGVWYTPEAVVGFIVRSVDEILISEFGLTDGLADTSKVLVPDNDFSDAQTQGATIRKKKVHRVQILDPAAGTGTFLAEVVKQIVPKVKRATPNMWGDYINHNLIPRLHGFEILMAPYSMCHLKLEMILKELGYISSNEVERMSVFLTNSLEREIPGRERLPFTQWLSKEAEGASAIKRDTPIMCIIGNPPYLGAAEVPKGWMAELMEDYKKEPGGKKKLKERNSRWLNDLYVQFIRMSSHLIEKNGEGILAFITNHSWLDNPTYRGMRWHMTQVFDKIHILDLHGNANRKEQAPDGTMDKNVFDIKMGVAIMVAIKNRESKGGGGATIYHGDLWGTREEKYGKLENGTINSSKTKKIETQGPSFIFAKRDYRLHSQYEEGFCLSKFMPSNSTGVVTGKDGLVIDFTVAALKDKISRFVDPDKSDSEVREEFFSNKKKGKRPLGDTAVWQLSKARQILQSVDWSKDIRSVDYRPFDRRVILYRPEMLEGSRQRIMRNFIERDNIAIYVSKQQKVARGFSHALVHREIIESGFVSNKTGEIGYSFPLYIYPDKDDLQTEREINFNTDLHAKIRDIAKANENGPPDEVQVLDYIYGVLYCPEYREAYADFLQSDFPKIPWPANSGEFWQVSAKGKKLRELHLMENEKILCERHSFNGRGVEVVDKPFFKDGRVYINKTEFFDDVSPASWDFCVGGERVAERWLKARKGKSLTYEDVVKYQGMLKIFAETQEIMKKIKIKL